MPVLSINGPTDNLAGRIRVGYASGPAGEKRRPESLTEIKVNAQQLLLLVPITELELLWKPGQEDVTTIEATDQDVRNTAGPGRFQLIAPFRERLRDIIAQETSPLTKDRATVPSHWISLLV